MLSIVISDDNYDVVIVQNNPVICLYYNCHDFVVYIIKYFISTSPSTGPRNLSLKKLKRGRCFIKIIVPEWQFRGPFVIFCELRC